MDSIHASITVADDIMDKAAAIIRDAQSHAYQDFWLKPEKVLADILDVLEMTYEEAQS